MAVTAEQNRAIGEYLINLPPNEDCGCVIQYGKWFGLYYGPFDDEENAPEELRKGIAGVILTQNHDQSLTCELFKTDEELFRRWEQIVEEVAKHDERLLQRDPHDPEYHPGTFRRMD